jgi:hypothetical protein
MKKILILPIILALLSVSSVFAITGTINITHDRYATVDYHRPNTNVAEYFGLYCHDHPDTGWDERLYLRYNLSPAENITVTGAYLYMNRSACNNCNVKAVRTRFCYDDTWNNSIIWNTQPCGAGVPSNNTVVCNATYVQQNLVSPPSTPYTDVINVTNFLRNETLYDEQYASLELEIIEVNCGAWQYVEWRPTNSYLSLQYCQPNWTIFSNTTSCFNSTNLKNNVTYQDTDCGLPKYSTITYPILTYSLISNTTTCQNSTTVLLNETYEDDESCSYFYSDLSYNNCPEFYSCSGGSCSYTGYCGDSVCQIGNGETQDNCCIDCGCPVFFRCEENSCYEKSTERLLSGAGEGTGTFLDAIRNPLVQIVLIFGVLSFFMFIFWGVATAMDRVIMGKRG